MMQLRIMKLLDRGLFSEVFFARDIINNRLFSIKKINEKNMNYKQKIK